MKGFFFDGRETGINVETGEVQYDREYQASDHAEYYEAVFTTGVFMLLNPDACKVVYEGSGHERKLSVLPGYCDIKGYRGKTEGDDEWYTAQMQDGLYRVIIRLDISEDVRAFTCEIVYGSLTEYPELVREGNIYDLCLANVEIAAGDAVTEDTRYDIELCGCTAFQGMPPRPPYHPPGDPPPLELWLYTIYPELLTQEQRQLIEENTQLMDMWRESNIATGKSLTGTLTLPHTGWADERATTGYYTVTVSVPEMLAVIAPFLGCGLSGTDAAADQLIQQAWNMVSMAESIDGGITFMARQAPSVSVPVSWKMGR